MRYEEEMLAKAYRKLAMVMFKMLTVAAHGGAQGAPFS
jgi:hypothetical protein